MNTKQPKEKMKHYKICHDVLVMSSTSLLAVIFFSIGYFVQRYELTKLILDDRLEMRQFTPHYKWWQNTSDVLVTCKMYVFSVTNAERWMQGLDEKLNFEEIGPIVYRETLEHHNVVFHTKNSTISYNSKRQLHFMADHNEIGILNRTITIPNTAVLAMAAKLQDSNSFIKWAFRAILSSSNDEVFVNTTIYNYLWNQTSPIIKSAKKIVPFMVPLENIGTLNTIYNDYDDRVNVRYGAQHGDEQFFMINSYRNRQTVPGYIPENGDCFASIVNSSEGALYQQNLDENSVIVYWRKTLCRAVPLYFKKKVHRGPILGYEYILPDHSYDRLANLSEDCYKGQNSFLEDGMTDMSKCYNDFPIAATSPHYFARNISMAKKISGMHPDHDKHYSYTIAEPILGIPIDQRARTQSNLVIPHLTGFPADIQKFSEMILPMFWIEYISHRNFDFPDLCCISFSLNT
ncbi:scavenger receptor class B member 1 isoform X2 [Armigeres subalbatus]|uniref:scavenger receptor class B member 1 isoform X2 n=1 Tax=Armigeres subalbatus TaxID=124917 RepID=UPI002ED2EC13